MRYSSPPSEFFKRNREKLAQQMKPGHAAIFFAADLQGQNADFHYPFVQDSNFYYLTGIDQEGAALFFFPDAPSPEWREILLMPKFGKFSLQVHGWKYSMEEAVAASGAAMARDIKLLERTLLLCLPFAEGLYVDVNEHEGRSQASRTSGHAFAEKMRRDFPNYPLLRAAPLLRKLRTIKEKEELKQIRIACSITDKAFRRAAAFVRPGRWEYEIEAEILHEFVRNRASGPAFPTIVASGKNSCVLHYISNEAECLPNELLQLDLGAEYAHYSADVSRVVPVSGRFLPRQKEVYQAVLRLLRFATDYLRPGALMAEHQKAVIEEVEKELVGLGLFSLEDLKNQNPESPLYKAYFMHSTSHHLGLDTHDLSERFAPMAPGMVLTVEPGIYLPQEGFGIRLEDDVLITEDGVENLTASIPIEVEEIEDLMNAN